MEAIFSHYRDFGFHSEGRRKPLRFSHSGMKKSGFCFNRITLATVLKIDYRREGGNKETSHEGLWLRDAGGRN